MTGHRANVRFQSWENPLVIASRRTASERQRAASQLILLCACLSLKSSSRPLEARTARFQVGRSLDSGRKIALSGLEIGQGDVLGGTTTVAAVGKR